MNVLIRRSVFKSLTRDFHKTAMCRNVGDQEIKIPKRIRKLKAKQRAFQIEDNVPIYLKAGARDKILFNTVLVLMGIGFIMSGHTLGVLMFK